MNNYKYIQTYIATNAYNLSIQIDVAIVYKLTGAPREREIPNYKAEIRFKTELKIKLEEYACQRAATSTKRYP